MDSTYTASNNGVWVCIKGITTGLYSLEVSLKTQQGQLTEHNHILQHKSIAILGYWIPSKTQYIVYL